MDSILDAFKGRLRIENSCLILDTGIPILTEEDDPDFEKDMERLRRALLLKQQLFELIEPHSRRCFSHWCYQNNPNYVISVTFPNFPV
jgi:hypothetical protein